MLDPDVVLRADAAAAQHGRRPRSARRCDASPAPSPAAPRAPQPALVGGAAGLVWAPGGRPRVAFVFTIADDRIAAVDLVADPQHLAALNPIIEA